MAGPRTDFDPGGLHLTDEWIRSLTYSNLKIYLPIIIFSFYLWSIDYRQSFFVRINHFVRISFWISFYIDSKFCLTLGRVHGQYNWPPEINPYCMFLADYFGTCRYCLSKTYPLVHTEKTSCPSTQRTLKLDLQSLEAIDMNPWTDHIIWPILNFHLYSSDIFLFHGGFNVD